MVVVSGVSIFTGLCELYLFEQVTAISTGIALLINIWSGQRSGLTIDR